MESLKTKILTSLIMLISLAVVIPVAAAVGVVGPFSLTICDSRQKSSLTDLYMTSQLPQTEWNRTYGGAKEDRASSVVETSDGGYMLAGYTTSSGAGSYDAWLVRVDSAGMVHWNRTYGGVDADRACSALETSDGGYVLAGSTLSFGAGNYDFWLVKVDSSGTMVWNKTYGEAENDVAHSLIQTSDGGYAIAGNTESYGAGRYDFWLVKVDSSGTMVWNKTYGEAENDVAHSLIQTSDGGYAITGYTKSRGAGLSDFWLVKTDAAGNMQWNKTYGGAEKDFAHSLIQTSDGGYAITGYTESYGAGKCDFWLLKASSSGNPEWNKTYGETDNELPYSLIQADDGGYAIAGHTNSSGVGGYDFWLVKTDSSGNSEWNKTYGGVEWDQAYSLVQTDEGGYAIAGYTASYGAGQDDLWLIKTEAEAESIHDVAITDITPAQTVTAQGSTLSINVTIVNQGTHPETVNVTTYANTTPIDTVTDVPLAHGDTAIITFLWDTTDFAYSNYTISAIADTIPGETDTADNIHNDGTVLVTIPGDVDGDGDVDGFDLTRMCGAYGSTPADPNWDEPCDINGDDVIDGFDLTPACGNYGKTT